MVLTDNFYITAEDSKEFITYNPDAVSMDSNNIQNTPVVFSIINGLEVYWTFSIENAVGEDVTVLGTIRPSTALNIYEFVHPADKYGLSNQVTVKIYSDAERKKEIATRVVSIRREKATPFPRPETEWNASLKFYNGDLIMIGDVVYQWMNPVPGNSTLSPKQDIEQNPYTTSWMAYPYSVLLATQVFLAKFALLGAAVFNQDYAFSQYGMDRNGNDTNNYRGLNYSDPMDPDNAFRPNILLDWKRGDAFFRKATLYECASVGQGYISLPGGGVTGRQYCPLTSNLLLLDGYNGGWAMLYVPADKSLNCNPNWDFMHFTVMNIQRYAIMLQLSQLAPLTVSNKDANIAAITLGPSRCVEFVFVVKRNVCGFISESGGMACQAGTFYLKNVYDFSIKTYSDGVGGYNANLVSMNLNETNE